MAEKPKLSIIITAHDEGLLAHKTLLSIFRSLVHVEAASIPYEIIVHIDNGDTATVNYYNRYKDDKRFRIFQNNFGDPALSRNFATRKAIGQYISFVDSDDLVSENWYLDGINMLDSEQRQNIVVHAQANLTFGVSINSPVLQLNIESSKDRTVNAMNMLGENNWHSFIMGPREIFLNFPYPETKNGYGHEDYAFNTSTLAAGIKHGVVKNSVLFYRQKKTSVSISNNSSNVIQPYSELFDIELFKNIPEPPHAKQKKRRLYRAYKKIRDNDFLNYFITPVAKVVKKSLDKTRHATKSSKFSGDISFVIEEWKNINVIENLLYPTKERLHNLTEYSPSVYLPVAQAYAKLAKQITKKPDYVFIVPWVVRGGADKVLLNYTKAITEIHPNWQIAVVTTLKAQNAWREKLADNVDLIDFGEVSTSLYEEEKDRLFSRLLTQLNCKKVHVINSEYAYLWMMNHKELMEKEYDLRISLFSRFTKSFNEKIGIFNYSTYAAEIEPAIKRIYTDNLNVIDILEEYEGIPKDKCCVHYQPVGIQPRISTRETTPSGKFEILWASRISEEKRPELLKQIAQKLDPEKFHIDVYGSFEPKYSSKMFDGIPSLTYCGAYNGPESLPTSKYDVFLYTSGIDGMPNIVLEMSALGLPIITSNAGGVKEFIKNEETGIYLENDSADNFVTAIKSATKNRKQLQEYVEKAQKLLTKRHSWNAFLETVKTSLNLD